MKLLFVWPPCTFSVYDVARGYRAALTKLLGNENIQDYFLDKHLAYHLKAVPEHVQNQILLSKMASENILNEAIYFGADRVLIISGLNVHPIVLLSLKHVGIPVTTVLTECPYNDDDQAEWAAPYPEMNLVTTEKISQERGWKYIPHAYDPEYHKPVEVCKDYISDVFFVGTGWANRQILFEQVDWTGINLKLYGIWDLPDTSPLKPFYTGMSLIDNTELCKYYSSTKVVLNLHRKHPTAYSMNPRAYEVAACGAFQICDKRQEVIDTFGDSVPTVETAKELEFEIRKALASDRDRQLKASMARECIQGHTFDKRAQSLMEVLH